MELASTASSGESRLLAAAHDVLVEHGPAGASARAIAQRANSSASAIHYHFQSVEALVDAALNDARARDNQWRRSLLAELQGWPLSAELLPHFLTGVASAAGTSLRGFTLLHWDAALEAALHTRFVPLVTAWRDDQNEFWAAALPKFGINASPQLAAEFVEAVSRLYLAVGTGPTHVAWASETITRFAERARGSALGHRQGTIWRDLHRRAPEQEADYQQKLESPMAERIVAAAVRIILTQGPRAVTHRAVASTADVSLSSTTYYFKSRGEILHAAFSRLRADAVARAHASAAEPVTSLSLDQLIERMANALVPASGEISLEYVAAQSLPHAAVRDVALRPHAQQLYASMGEATLRLFKQTHEIRAASDPLAAFIYALWTDAMLCNAYLENADMVASEVRSRQRAMLALLFPVR